MSAIGRPLPGGLSLQLETRIAAVDQAFAVALGGSLPAWLHRDAHRWRHALPETPIGEACLWNAELRLGACGDWCLEGRVEAAFDSGRRLAQRISTPDGGAAGEPIA